MQIIQPTQGNRVKDALLLYVQNQAQHIAANPVGWRNDREALGLKQQWYENIDYTYSSGIDRKNKLTPAERQSLAYVRRELNKMDAIMRPTVLNRLLHHPIMLAIRSFLTGNSANFRRHSHELERNTRAHLKELNVQALRHTMQQAGFTGAMDTTLQKMMDQGFDQFHLRYSDLQCKNTSFVLHFEKVPGSDYYYFQSFTANATPELSSLFNESAASTGQNFPLQQEFCFTASQAAVLVNNGHVCKTVEGTECWMGLDLTRKTTGEDIPIVKYPFDLAKALHKLPIKPLSETQFSKLVNNLKEGLTRTVDLFINDKTERCTIKAGPHVNQILVFDKHKKPLDLRRNGKSLSVAKKQREGTLKVIDEPVSLPDKKRKIK